MRLSAPGRSSALTSSHFSSKILLGHGLLDLGHSEGRGIGGVQNPITVRRPVVQLRSKITTSLGGECGRYRWMYICDFSRSVGAAKAVIRNTRGLTRSVIRLIVPPLPAVSRPSNTMQILAPVALTHSCMATSSPCRTRISRSYS